jgi:hypothetical protein
VSRYHLADALKAMARNGQFTLREAVAACGHLVPDAVALNRTRNAAEQRIRLDNDSWLKRADKAARLAYGRRFCVMVSLRGLIERRQAVRLGRGLYGPVPSAEAAPAAAWISWTTRAVEVVRQAGGDCTLRRVAAELGSLISAAAAMRAANNQRRSDRKRGKAFMEGADQADLIELGRRDIVGGALCNAVNKGRLIRVRRGVYALPPAPEDRRAV